MKAGSWIQKVNGILKLFVFVLKLLFCTEKENQTMEDFFLKLPSSFLRMVISLFTVYAFGLKLLSNLCGHTPSMLSNWDHGIGYC